MSSYIDNNAIINVLGTLYKHPNLIEQEDKYFFDVDDYVTNFHRVVFTSIYNLKLNGLHKISTTDIEMYLKDTPSLHSVYEQGKGSAFLDSLNGIVDIEKFDYYYQRVKKFTLLRKLDHCGVDVKKFYDPDEIMDQKKITQQQHWLELNSLEEIANQISDSIQKIIDDSVTSTLRVGCQAGEGLKDLIARMKDSPEIGIPMYGEVKNTIYRGARLKKFYLCSAPTGAGKTRKMVADACMFSMDEIFEDNKWQHMGSKQPTLVITTELEPEEVQTMIVAFVANVTEGHILNADFKGGEEARIDYAVQQIEKAPLWIEQLSDFSLRDIENTIRRYVREHGVRYVAFDYIMTSMKILEEITKRSGGVKLREDQILLMMSIRLKDLCNELGIFIESATQISGEWEDKADANQQLLRGSKAIADKIDGGEILLPVRPFEKERLEKIIEQNPNLTMPTHVYHVYKNRRGEHNFVKVWCVGHLGTCRLKPVFTTDNNFNVLNIEGTKITMKEVLQF